MQRPLPTSGDELSFDEHDERLQLPGLDHGPWVDTMAFHASATRLALELDISMSVRWRSAGRSVCCASEVRLGVGGEDARHDQHQQFEVLDEPSSDWDVMQIGPVRCSMVEAGRIWTVAVDDPKLKVYLTFEGTGTCEAEPFGHGYHQPCRVFGDVLLDRRRLRIETNGHRMHAWGPIAPE